MSNTVTFTTWLEHLKLLFPPRHALLIGAGTGTGTWVKLLDKWKVPAATLVEADSTQFQQLKQNVLPRDNWQLLQDVIAAESQELVFHRFSLSAENGIIPLEGLQSIWPHLKEKERQIRAALSLPDLIQELECQPNWIVIDCLSASLILQGVSALLDDVDIIIARAGLSDMIDAPLSHTHLDAELTESGYMRIALEQERNPATAYALYMRDISHIKTTLHASGIARQFAESKQQELLSKNETLQKNVQEKNAQIDKLNQELVYQKEEVEKYQREATDAQQKLKISSNIDSANELNTKGLEDVVTRNISSLKESIQADVKNLEAKVRGDISKGLANSVKQLESFISIQSYLTGGDFISDFHGWPISPDIGLFLLEKMRRESYDLIVEFGSGTSTALFAKAAQVLMHKAATGAVASYAGNQTEIISFEHDLEYHAKTLKMLQVRQLDQHVRLTHAPLINWKDGEQTYLYYDCSSILSKLAEKYEKKLIRILVLVDGPPGATCMNARYPAVPSVFEALGKHQIDLVLDDASRPEEKAVIDLWRTFWKKRSICMSEITVPSEKGIYFATNKN